MRRIPASRGWRCRRYIVRGKASLRHQDGESLGSLVNIGRCEMLIRAEHVFPEGASLNVFLTIPGYHQGVEAAGTVRGRKDGMLVLELVEETARVEELLLWLQDENFPWTLADASERPPNPAEQIPRRPPSLSAAAQRAQIDEREMENLLAHLHQLG